MTRRFGTEPLEPGVLGALLDTARRAPSAGYSQGTHFLVLTQGRDSFWDVTGLRAWFSDLQPGVLDAPHLVLALADPAAYTGRYDESDKAGAGLADPGAWPVPYWLTDTAMAVQNLLLLVEEAGLGALWFGVFRNDRRLLDSLGVPASVGLVGVVALGHRADDDRPSGSATSRPRRPVGDVVHDERW